MSSFKSWLAKCILHEASSFPASIPPTLVDKQILIYAYSDICRVVNAKEITEPTICMYVNVCYQKLHEMHPSGMLRTGYNPIIGMNK